MVNQESGSIAKMRQLFDNSPYPKIPLEQSPKDDLQALYIHNAVTPYYLKSRKVVGTESKLILDAGCGTGYKSLILAYANPGAKIIGIDLSEKSVELARQRLQHHGFDNVEFHVLSIEELPQLGLEFDLINADEVLYLLPDTIGGLQAMKAVLKPEGIIRTNLHTSLGRKFVYRAQEVSSTIGLMEQAPGKEEVDAVREVMLALKDDVLLKQQTWNYEAAKQDGWVLANHLLMGDKGYTIPEIFAALKAVDLELVSTVNWRQWDLLNLFKEPDDLPAFIGMSLPEISTEEQLHIFELLHPVHRLFDFWCTHANQTQSFVPVSEWTAADWQEVRVHLHPELMAAAVKEDLLKCTASQTPFEISRYLPLPAVAPIVVESLTAAWLLPLWEGPQSVQSLSTHRLGLAPLHPVTLEPVSEETALEEVKEVLSELEPCLYVLLEREAG